MPDPTTPTEPRGPDPDEQPVLPEQPTPSDQPPPAKRPEPPGQAEGTIDGEARKNAPEYKGEPLDAERGPGLGCFWTQISLLTFFLIFTPLTVTWGWDPTISAALLIFTLILLLFSGQTIIFLLRLVAADRRTRRTPLAPGAKPTVGQMEDTPAAPQETSSAPGSEATTEPSPEREAAAGSAAETEADDD